ncbi:MULTISPECIES: hypothetical protein [unclassified Lentilitoribacter]|uniref:hypothetical protein n=1 Tax=unclassified Lentilitoribacter TaxID=2647570 RepID=UPI0018D61DAA|nr:hypothetical protein [Lentilitoribacter sp. Alg239-R112]
MINKTVLIAGLAGLLATSAVQAEKLNVDVWADNWFAFYSGEKEIKEDSVSINTERSFNKESFTFNAERPFVLNFVVKDFKENDSGLEYIGSRKQQMGDGGFIAQFKDSSGKTVAVTNSSWRCMVTHNAPSNKSCEKDKNPVAGKGNCGFTKTAEPSGWKSPSFDDSSWPKASEYSERSVGPKDGYDQVRWDSGAKLIWGPDLETNNTLLCRTVIK